MTAAAWESGSPMEVPAIRGMTAISVVGILGEGCVDWRTDNDSQKIVAKGRMLVSFLETSFAIEMSSDGAGPAQTAS
jgi:hypothetical protein